MSDVTSDCDEDDFIEDYLSECSEHSIVSDVNEDVQIITPRKLKITKTDSKKVVEFFIQDCSNDKIIQLTQHIS